MSPSSLRPARRGFTLIELMVSTALMVIIVLAVVSIAADTFKAYDRAVADLSTQSEARSVLDALENDFQTAVIRPDGRCWMEIVLPASSATGGPALPPPAVGNLNPAEHPIIMLFAAPQDRPRWRPDQTSATAPRVALKGDVCAVAYRIGQRSPFNTPGTGNQQIYGVYRTIIDSEKTFADALPIILAGTAAAPKSPWDYWSTTTPGTRTYGDYNNQKYTTAGTPLINAVVSASSGMPWTLDDHNFLASNVVGMNLVLWCTSSLPQSTTVTVAPLPLTDPLKRPALMLRPILPVNKADVFDQGAKFSNGTGYRAAYSTGTSSADTLSAPLHYAPTVPSVPAVVTTGTHPYEEFSGRLRIYSDRIYPDALSSATAPTATQLPYLPYSLRAIEVSVTVLTPEGAKELALLQSLPSANVSGSGTKVTTNDFKRIIVQQGRAYTRYIRLLSNGG
jgi:prepilin-type N-terminal cleavage/methylation domain-containing protein